MARGDARATGEGIMTRGITQAGTAATGDGTAHGTAAGGMIRGIIHTAAGGDGMTLITGAGIIRIIAAGTEAGARIIPEARLSSMTTGGTEDAA